MPRARLTAILCLCLASPAWAGDFYVISRQTDGTFVSSHRVFERNSETLHAVTLCGQPYFARAATVAWMGYEADEGRSVGLEYNEGNGWFRICPDPQEQVTLADIGVEGENHVVMRASQAALNRQQRFTHIRKAFQGLKNSGETAPSFHAK